MKRLLSVALRKAGAGAAQFALVLLAGCATRDNYLGFDRVEVLTTDGVLDDAPLARGADAAVSQPSISDASVAPPPAPVMAPPPSDDDAGASLGEPPPDAVVDAEPEPPRSPLVADVDLPNLFTDVLGIEQTEVDARLDAAFTQLFHGNPDTQSVYFEVDGVDDEAYIYDVLHDDTRLDAMGYGLMITVQMDRQQEFDKLWTFARNRLLHEDGPYAGYFRSRCDVDGETCDAGAGVFGAFYIATALLFAEGRWGNGTGILNYGAEARARLDVMLHKEARDGVVSLFDETNHLPHFFPDEPNRGFTSPGALTPAFFEFWGAATSEPAWTLAAISSRVLVGAAAHPETGLLPRRIEHDGTVVEGDEVFNEGCYATGVNIALDYAWYGADDGQVGHANRMLRFFADFPAQPYPAIYSYAGESLNDNPSGALVAINGATASIATAPVRAQFIRRVWETPMHEGIFRFFDGINQMLALMVLSGTFRAY
jgi:oligosaccharide reducing-end xylanase